MFLNYPVINTLVYKLVRTPRFWSNLYRVRSK